MYDLQSFGSRVKKRREALGYKQFELAELLDVTPNHLSAIENGKAKPSYDLICSICEQLNVTPDYLFLGNLHSNNVPQNIIDNLRTCSDEDIRLAEYLVGYLAERQNSQI